MTGCGAGSKAYSDKSLARLKVPVAARVQADGGSNMERGNLSRWAFISFTV